MDLAQTTRQLLITFFLCQGFLAWPQSCVIDLNDLSLLDSTIDLFLPKPITVTQIMVNADEQSEYALSAVVPKASFILDKKLLQKIASYSAQTKQFKQINIDLGQNDHGHSLTISPEKAWLFDRVTINGFMFGKDVFKRLYLMHSGDGFDRECHAASCQNILSYLHGQGYFEARVIDHMVYDQQRMMVSVDITVVYGPQFYVNEVQLLGTDNDDTVLRVMVNKAYNKEIIDTHCQAFRQTLVQQGYYPLSFVIKNKIEYVKKIVTVIIDLTLSEQRLFLFHGNTFLSDQQLMNAISALGKSAWIIPYQLIPDLIIQEYERHGFKQANVSIEKKDVGYLLKISEGIQKSDTQRPFTFSMPSAVEREKPDVFGATIIQNLSTIPTHLIERELAYDEGDSCDNEAIRQSIKNLNSLQVFDEVSLCTIFDPYDPDRKTMLLKVHNDLPYELRLKGGIGLQQMSKDFIFKGVSYVAGGSFLIKNPFNRADLFSVDADYTFGEQNLAIRYTYPWLFNLRMRTYVEIYVNQYLQPGLRHNHKNIYSFVQQGFLFGTHYENGPLDGQCNVGLEWMKTTMVNKQDNPFFNQEITHALYFEPLLVDKKIPYVLLEPQMVVNTTDNKLNPHSGNLSLVSCKAMIPWRYLSFNSFFIKFLFDHSTYIPIYNSVLALRARAGHIFYKEFKNVMPAERFYLGGANSIRSYETDLCPPLGTIVNVQGKTCFVPQGARSMVNLNAELRFPAYRGVWFALFQDLGALSNNCFADIKARDIVAGTGLGIRYETPIGPLRFDVAFKWHRPDPRISRYCWFLSFGNAF